MFCLFMTYLIARNKTDPAWKMWRGLTNKIRTYPVIYHMQTKKQLQNKHIFPSLKSVIKSRSNRKASDKQAINRVDWYSPVSAVLKHCGFDSIKNAKRTRRRSRRTFDPLPSRTDQSKQVLPIFILGEGSRMRRCAGVRVRYEWRHGCMCYWPHVPDVCEYAYVCAERWTKKRARQTQRHRTTQENPCVNPFTHS